MLTSIIILLFLAAGFYLVYRYVTDPFRIIFMIVLGILLIVFLFRLVGVGYA